MKEEGVLVINVVMPLFQDQQPSLYSLTWLDQRVGCGRIDGHDGIPGTVVIALQPNMGKVTRQQSEEVMNHDSKALFDSITSHGGEGPKLAVEQETLGALVRCYRVILQGSFGSFFINRTRLRSCIFTTLCLTEMRTNETEGD